MSKNLIDSESYEFVEGTEKSDYTALEGRVSTAEGNISGHELRLTTAENDIVQIDENFSVLAQNITETITILPFAFDANDPHEITIADQLSDISLPIPMNMGYYSALMFEWYIVTLQPSTTLQSSDNALSVTFLNIDESFESLPIKFIFTDNYDADGVNYRINTITQIVRKGTGRGVEFGTFYDFGTEKELRSTTTTFDSFSVPYTLAKIRIRFPRASLSGPRIYNRGIILRITGVK